MAASLSLSPQVLERLQLFCATESCTIDEAMTALQWVTHPTTRPIVGIREFIESPYYMNAPRIVYPMVMVEIEECNNGQYSEAVFTGSIGAGKTTAALYSLAYQLYVLSCYEDPHALYDLDPASEIVFVIQSLRLSSADNDYDRFKAMIERAPYFQKFFAFDKKLESEMAFPRRIKVKPVSGAETATIGENVFGGLIDEVNFMAVVESGKAAKASDTGIYDQAMALYNSISKRRKSRFGMGGRLPGLLCLVSSRRYPGQFTDVKEQEAALEKSEKGYTSIFVYDKRVWEIKDGFSEEKFPVFIGDAARRPRILTKKEATQFPKADENLIDWIPVDFLDDFRRDILTALRDIAGKATLAKHPFIVDREAITKSFRHTNILFSRERVDFVETELLIYPKAIYKPQLPRFFHSDLAITGDSAGFAIGTVLGFKQCSAIGGVKEMLPVIHIDGLLEIAPPKGGEIMLYKVRDIIHALRKQGMNIRWGSFDQFQCVAGNTSIWTDHGLVDARHIEEGMVVQSRIGPRPVTKKWSFGVQPTIVMTTTDHSVLEMTGTHKIEVAKKWHYQLIDGKRLKRPIWEWKMAKELQVGDVVRAWDRPSDVDRVQLAALPRMKSPAANSIKYSVPKALTPEFAQFLGVVWGDGHVRQDDITVTCAAGEQDCAAATFRKAFNCEPVIRKRANHYIVSVCSRDIVKWLSECGLVKNDMIPELIRHSPKAVQAAFIRGLFSTDGSVGKADGECSFSTKNWEWAEYVHVFLRSAFGISSCIVKSKRTGDNYPTLNEIQYIVMLRGGRAKFHQHVGFCYAKKQQLLEKHLGVKGRDLWVRVKSLEASEAEVFDFEVQEDHAYIANGLVSHNSRDSMQLLKQAGLAVGYQSIDVGTGPYDFVKNALYDGRLSLPEHEKAQIELASLEKNVKKNKIDHPPGGSKDVADALAGVVFGLTMRREIWSMYGIQPVLVPQSIKDAQVKANPDKIKAQA